MNSPYTSLPPLTGSVDHCQGSARNTLSAVLTLTAVVEVAVPTLSAALQPDRLGATGLSGSIRIRNGTMEF
jgi:hypothetical protein